MSQESLWTWREVADYLKLSRSWVYREAEAGRLPCLRLPSAGGKGSLRFEPEQIRAYARGEWAPRAAA